MNDLQSVPAGADWSNSKMLSTKSFLQRLLYPAVRLAAYAQESMVRNVACANKDQPITSANLGVVEQTTAVVSSINSEFSVLAEVDSRDQRPPLVLDRKQSQF